MRNIKAQLSGLTDLPQGYSSENTRKYTSRNPLVQWAIRRSLQDLLSLCQRIAPRSILDIGCGEGLVGNYLIRHLKEGAPKTYVGADRSFKTLNVAAYLNSQASYVCTEISQLSFRDKSADLVLCLEVLEHLPDPAFALSELRRVSSRYCLISVPHEPFFQTANFLRARHIGSWGNHPEHLHHWGSSSFRKLVSHFFTIQEFHRRFPWLLVLCSRPKEPLNSI